MPERIAEIIILAEDLTQGNFVRRYLERANQDPRRIRLRIAPAGRGSAEQYVRECYSTEVTYYRERAASRSAALVVAIDADASEVADRERELEEALVAEQQPRRQPDEAIALLIPKRNIETWILCLCKEQVDEVTDYKTRVVSRQIALAAKVFYDWSRPNYVVPGACVPSLRRGLTEIRRVGKV